LNVKFRRNFNFIHIEVNKDTDALKFPAEAESAAIL
jgi:hypothetical protein